eukprot:TRINITY_DN16691_c0_g1_i1.p1 TRINITY_DN16691_c0_g1~~TRINITY_DN16691_c0_g1_i1.p1  ORF type:complete len:881 (+),score=201.47 TRINITY_DN16691_c0_g1_i1:168-2645(+)
MKLSLDIARGMKYMHTQTPAVMHLDLKTPNILVYSLDHTDEVCVKISDFGLSSNGETQYTRLVANPVWLAPEILIGLPYTFSNEVYAFGVIMFEILQRTEFFGELSFLSELAELVMDGKRPEIRAGGIPAYVTLLRKCWSQQPEDRPDFKSVVVDLMQIEEDLPKYKSLAKLAAYLKQSLVVQGTTSVRSTEATRQKVFEAKALETLNIEHFFSRAELEQFSQEIERVCKSTNFVDDNTLINTCSQALSLYPILDKARTISAPQVETLLSGLAEQLFILQQIFNKSIDVTRVVPYTAKARADWTSHARPSSFKRASTVINFGSASPTQSPDGKKPTWKVVEGASRAPLAISAAKGEDEQAKREARRQAIQRDRLTKRFSTVEMRQNVVAAEPPKKTRDSVSDTLDELQAGSETEEPTIFLERRARLSESGNLTEARKQLQELARTEKEEARKSRKVLNSPNPEDSPSKLRRTSSQVSTKNIVGSDAPARRTVDCVSEERKNSEKPDLETKRKALARASSSPRLHKIKAQPTPPSSPSSPSAPSSGTVTPSRKSFNKVTPPPSPNDTLRSSGSPVATNETLRRSGPKSVLAVAPASPAERSIRPSSVETAAELLAAVETLRKSESTPPGGATAPVIPRQPRLTRELTPPSPETPQVGTVPRTRTLPRSSSCVIDHSLSPVKTLSARCTRAEALQTVEALKLCLRQLIVSTTGIQQSTTQTPDLPLKMQETIGVTKKLQEHGKLIQSINSGSPEHNASQERVVKEIVQLVPTVIKFISASQKIGVDPNSGVLISQSFKDIIDSIKMLSVIVKDLHFDTGRASFPIQG